MHFLIRAAMLLAAGAAGWALAKRSQKPQQEEGETRVYYIDDEDASVQADEAGTETAAAEVLHCFRRMDPLTLNGASDVTFILADATEVRLTVTGEGGLHLHEGDAGMLTWSGNTFILFEKDNGEMIGGMYYAPAGEAEADE